MISSRCESDPEGAPRRLQRRRRVSVAERLITWVLPVILCVIVVRLIIPGGPRRAPPGGTRAAGDLRWAPRGGGSVDFLEEEQPFEVCRQFGGGSFRIAAADGTAFEAPRLDRVVQSFVRERLAAVRVGDRVTVRFWLGTVSTGMSASALRENALVWAIAIDEVEKDGETWFRAARGGSGQYLYARALDELREKILRELAREVVALHGADGGP